MKKEADQAAHARAGLHPSFIWAVWFCVFAASQAGAIQSIRQEAKTAALIQIGVEVIEVDEQKTQKLGIQWLDSLLVSESQVPAVLQLGTLARDKITATLQSMLQEGAADHLANPKLVSRDGTTAIFHAGGEIP